MCTDPEVVGDEILLVFNYLHSRPSWMSMSWNFFFFWKKIENFVICVEVEIRRGSGRNDGWGTMTSIRCVEQERPEKLNQLPALMITLRPTFQWAADRKESGMRSSRRQWNKRRRRDNLDERNWFCSWHAAVSLNHSAERINELPFREAPIHFLILAAGHSNNNTLITNKRIALRKTRPVLGLRWLIASSEHQLMACLLLFKWSSH